MSTTRPVSVPSPNVAGQRLAIDDDARGELRRRAHPAPDDHRDLARQHRVVAEQRHQAVGELAADEGVVAAALGGAERLQLVEQGELRRPGQRAEQVPLEPRHRLRRENRRRMLAGQARARHAQHRHQEVEERRQLGVPDGVGRIGRRRRGSGRTGAGIELPLGRADRRRGRRPPGGPRRRWRRCGPASRARRSRPGAATAPGRRRSSTARPRSGGVRRLRDRPARRPGSTPAARPGPARWGRRPRSGCALPASAKAVRSKTLAAPIAIWRRSSPVRWVSSDRDSTGATLVTASGRDGAGNP